ncbi:uncharacterized protein GGS22DRAFT_158925 [Annulohypoxylon maeteangense]|uniref:uncharacterized protein n=1 Tax=Annulohypoxylon maeteangense TaxID=1927788 RepID=UPI0020084052|nr:uncharacterized protein GGS22DRAFT_158925 [Annulohypoxylon maeteangense]KAI0886888.1 hypothetical protein GGS22DRAFT_158925 [Annulohypoxylon maeteangense]
MPCYYDDHYWSHSPSRNLAHRFSLSREHRHSGYGTQYYIVNEGKVVIDKHGLKDSEAVIYNAPGSSLRFSDKYAYPRRSSLSITRRSSHYESPMWSSYSSTRRCHGCYEHRELYYGNYCHDCTSMQRISSPRERYLLDDEYRHIPRITERRRVAWH